MNLVNIIFINYTKRMVITWNWANSKFKLWISLNNFEQLGIWIRKIGIQIRNLEFGLAVSPKSQFQVNFQVTNPNSKFFQVTNPTSKFFQVLPWFSKFANLECAQFQVLGACSESRFNSKQQNLLQSRGSNLL